MFQFARCAAFSHVSACVESVLLACKNVCLLSSEPYSVLHISIWSYRSLEKEIPLWAIANETPVRREYYWSVFPAGPVSILGNTKESLILEDKLWRIQDVHSYLHFRISLQLLQHIWIVYINNYKIITLEIKKIFPSFLLRRDYKVTFFS